MSYDEEGWTLVTQRRPCKKQVSHSYPNPPRRGRHEWNTCQHLKKKEKNNSKRKQTIVQIDDILVQKLITPITLGEYFSLGFFDKMVTILTHMVSCNETSKEEGLSEDEESILGVESRKTKEEEGVVASLQHVPSPFSSHEMLQLPNEMRNALIQVLKNPTLYATKINEAKRLENESHNYAKCCVAITFIDNDLQLGSKPYNRPLFVIGYIREQNITRSLIDEGSAVNIMPKETMKRLKIATKELTQSCLMI